MRAWSRGCPSCLDNLEGDELIARTRVYSRFDLRPELSLGPYLLHIGTGLLQIHDCAMADWLATPNELYLVAYGEAPRHEARAEHLFLSTRRERLQHLRSAKLFLDLNDGRTRRDELASALGEL